MYNLQKVLLLCRILSLYASTPMRQSKVFRNFTSLYDFCLFVLKFSFLCTSINEHNTAVSQNNHPNSDYLPHAAAKMFHLKNAMHLSSECSADPPSLTSRHSLIYLQAQFRLATLILFCQQSPLMVLRWFLLFQVPNPQSDPGSSPSALSRITEGTAFLLYDCEQSSDPSAN